MTRPLDAATSTALGLPDLPFAALLYLDILGDPLITWNGIGDLPFALGATGDPSLDGNTFLGIGSIIEISAASDGVGGSDALEVALPGVDPFQPAMRQVITNRNRWQFRRAVVWLMALDPDTLAIVGKPFRIKTGRMDRMPFNEANKEAVIKCSIEGQQAYGNSPLGTRYSEAIDINPNDISQNFVYSLANMSPQMGQASAASGGYDGGGGGGGGGQGGGQSVRFSQNNTQLQ